MNRNLNQRKIPMDLNWIKTHLYAIDAHVNSIFEKLVFKVDQQGNVIFQNNVSIDNSSEKNIRELYETVEHLKEQIESISDLGDLTVIEEQLTNMKKLIEALQNLLAGIYRDNYRAETHITDETILHNNLVIDDKGLSNASLIGYGGQFGLSDATAIKCSTNYTAPTGIEYVVEGTWQPAKDTTDPNVYQQEGFYMINLLQGEYENSETSIRYHSVQANLTFKCNDYTISMNIDGGECYVDSSGLTLTCRLGRNTEFHRSSLTVEFQPTSEETYEVVIPEQTYEIDSSDNEFTFTSNDWILRDGSIQRRTTSVLPVIYINENIFEITNTLEDEGVSRVVLLKSDDTAETTKLNGYILSGSEYDSEWETFKREYNIQEPDPRTSLESNGLTVDTLPTDGNAIDFKGNGDLNVNLGKEFNVNVVNGSSVNSVYNVNVDGDANVNSVSTIHFNNEYEATDAQRFNNIISETYTEEGATEPQEVITINSNVRFKWLPPGSTDPADVQSITINELVNKQDTDEIKKLRDRVITLERNTMYSSTNYTNNVEVYGEEEPTDARVAEYYYGNPEIKHTGVDPESS